MKEIRVIPFKEDEPLPLIHIDVIHDGHSIYETHCEKPVDDKHFWITIQSKVAKLLGWKFPGEYTIFYLGEEKNQIFIPGMTGEEFNRIRKGIKFSQTELAAILKSKTGTGSRSLIQKIEDEQTPVKVPVWHIMKDIERDPNAYLDKSRVNNTFPDYCRPRSFINQSHIYRRCLFDPRLPDHFYNLTMDKRSAEELEQWHGQPYISTKVCCDPDSGPYIQYTLYCLDDDSWDMPTKRFVARGFEVVIQFIEVNYPNKML